VRVCRSGFQRRTVWEAGRGIGLKSDATRWG
jgi:hypothetical protein